MINILHKHRINKALISLSLSSDFFLPAMPLMDFWAAAGTLLSISSNDRENDCGRFLPAHDIHML